jgi:hypothetical protein
MGYRRDINYLLRLSGPTDIKLYFSGASFTPYNYYGNIYRLERQDRASITLPGKVLPNKDSPAV